MYMHERRYDKHMDECQAFHRRHYAMFGCMNVGRSSLRSVSRGDLLIPFARTAKMNLRSFSVVGPTLCKSLPLLSDPFHVTPQDHSATTSRLFFSTRPGSGAP